MDSCLCGWTFGKSWQNLMMSWNLRQRTVDPIWDFYRLPTQSCALSWLAPSSWFINPGSWNLCTYSRNGRRWKRKSFVTARKIWLATTQGSVCKVRTQDPENFDEVVKSLVSARRWKVDRGLANQYPSTNRESRNFQHNLCLVNVWTPGTEQARLAA